MRRLVVIVGVSLTAGCSRTKVSPCDRIDTLCQAGFDSDDLRECTAQLPEVIADKWDTFASCTANAGTCLEAIECASGTIDERGRQLLSRLARGPSSTKHGRVDNSSLPPECTRANDVCADDEPFARSKCARMVGNLKADVQNRQKLVACYTQANNCFAFQKCTDQMWIDLH